MLRVLQDDLVIFNSWRIYYSASNKNVFCLTKRPNLIFRTPIEESSSDVEKEIVDEKLDRTEAELKKIATGMCQVIRGQFALYAGLTKE